MSKWISFGLIAIYCFWGLKALGENEMKEVRIEYLNPYQANISSHGINRLHFEGLRVTRIIGDSSKYGASLNSLGTDLFLISKVAAPEVITLSLQGSDSRIIDLKLLVKDLKEGVILNIDIAPVSLASVELKAAAAKMIEHMANSKKGKYFVEERHGKNRIILNSQVTLTDYVSYRYGDLKGIGFEVSSIFKRTRKGQDQHKPITKQEIAQSFDNVVAVGFKEGAHKNSKGRLFIVFNNGNGDA